MSDKSFRLAIASPADSQDIVDFFNSAAGETDNLSFGGGEYDLTLKKQEEHLIRTLKEKNEVRILARDVNSGELLGSGSTYSLYRQRSRHVFHLGVVVRKANWRQGVGRALMERLMEEATNLGAEKLGLDVNASNLVAIRLYESLGFETEGRLKNELKVGDRYYDLIIMGRLLK